MKRSILLFALLVIFAGIQAQPRLNFPVLRHDYGVLKEEAGKQEVVFNFTNTGDSVLVHHQGTAIMRMHSLRLYKISDTSGREGFCNRCL